MTGSYKPNETNVFDDRLDSHFAAVRKLLLLGYSPERIARETGLSVSNVRRLVAAITSKARRTS
jgi:DNA-binding NarL/FixJ family response regulator